MAYQIDYIVQRHLFNDHDPDLIERTVIRWRLRVAFVVWWVRHGLRPIRLYRRLKAREGSRYDSSRSPRWKAAMTELRATPGAIALEASRERVRQKNLQELRHEMMRDHYNNTPAGQIAKLRRFIVGLVLGAPLGYLVVQWFGS